MTVTGQAWTSARTLDALGRHFGLTDARLGELAGGYARATVQGRRNGRKALSTEELEDFAAVFGVPPYVLLMEAADAIRWVLDNIEGGGIPETSARQAERVTTSDQQERHTMWYRRSAGHGNHLRLVTALTSEDIAERSHEDAAA